MIISRITTQKQNKQRYNIYVDEGQGERFGFGIDEDLLIKYQLKKGMELDHSTYEKICNAEAFHQSYLLAIRYLSYRMRSKQEVETYLKKKIVETEHIPRIIEKLENDNILDDEAFSTRFVRHRMHMSQKGPLLVKQELIAKGVTDKIAARAVEQYTYSIQYEKAEKVAQKKLDQKRKNALKKRLQSIKVALVQKGFTEDVIQDVVGNIVVSNEVNEEWEAIVFHGNKLFRRYENKYARDERKRKVKEGLYRQGFSLQLMDTFLEQVDKQMLNNGEDVGDDSL